jgi:hypothetical protein
MSKVSLFKMPHVDVNRPTADVPLAIQLQEDGSGFLVSEKAGQKTTFPVSGDDLLHVAMILGSSESVKNIAKHLMSYYAHDMDRVVEFLNTTADESLHETMHRIHDKMLQNNNK